MTEAGAQARRRCVLLADPDAERRRATAVHLRLGGYRVVEAAALRDIPEAARDGVDILVSEAQLTDGSALAYAAFLRRDARTAALPILIATHDGEEARRAARALGDRAALELPVAPSALLDRIGELLAGARA